MSNYNSGIELIFWGVRGSIARPGPYTQVYGGNTTCLQITLPEKDHLLLFDCGSGCVNLGNKLAKSPRPVNGRIFFSHCHWDHVLAIPFFKPFYATGNTFDIHMHPQDGNSCRDIVNMIMSPAFFPVTTEALHAELNFINEKFGRVQYSEGYSVESTRVQHPGTTVMYKIEALGKTIVFCPDNEYPIASAAHKASMDDFIRGADVLIHDSQETRDSYKLKHGWGHSPWEDVTELAASLGVKNLFLTHHDPEATDEILDERSRALEAYSQHFDHVQFARDKDRFRI